jgi:uncharacterized protein DUF6602
MPAPFYERLRAYYIKVAEVLRGEADAAKIFPNTTDIGMSRERVYAEFLRTHVPSKCNVFFGGYVFGDDGSESKQTDVIVTTDTAPRFNFHNPDGVGKAFSPVEGTLAVASIKSNLDKDGLFDALEGIASIPPTASLDKRVLPLLKVENYEDWPYKIVYATRSISPQALLTHLFEFYQRYPNIPFSRRPHLIHVSGQLCVFRAITGMSMWDIPSGKSEKLDVGSFHPITKDPDLQAILWTLQGIQERATASSHILFGYGSLINRVNDLP